MRHPAGSPNKADASGRHIVDRRQRVADMFDITQVVGIVAGFALVATLVFFLKGLYLIRAGEVGVLVKRLGGRKMPPDRSSPDMARSGRRRRR